MEDDDGYISLLVERGDRGEYWYYPVAKGNFHVAKSSLVISIRLISFWDPGKMFPSSLSCKTKISGRATDLL